MNIKFLGREAWADNLYKSGLYWLPNQVRTVDFALGRKLLHHIDLFAETKEKPGRQDDTAQIMRQAAKQQQQQDDELNDTLDTFQNVERMERDQLMLFAKQQFNFDLNKKTTTANMRSQVKTLIDQFGLA